MPGRARTPALKSTQVEKIDKVRAELNIERWPGIWQPAKSKSRRQLRVLERQLTMQDGSTMVSRVEISFNHLGTLTTEEQKMFYALLKQWEDSDRPDSQVFFSDRHLARILGKGWGTNVIDSLTKSLRKLRSVSLEWINSYYDKTNEGNVLRERRPFTILGELKIIERSEHGAVNKAMGYFRFDDHILRNLLANYTKPFFLQEFFKIKTDIGLLLYNHVDLILANKDRYERCTRELFADLGLHNADYLHMHKRKRALVSPLRELVGLRISTGVISSALVEKTADKRDYKIVITKRSAKSSDAVIESSSPEEGSGRKLVVNHYRNGDELTRTLACELVQYFYELVHGVRNDHVPDKAVDQAITLLAKYGEEKVRHIIRFGTVAAKETNFQMQHFGGIVHYASRALAEYDRTQKQPPGQIGIPPNGPIRPAAALKRRVVGERRLAALSTEALLIRQEQAKLAVVQKHPFLAHLGQDSKVYQSMVRSHLVETLEHELMALVPMELIGRVHKMAGLTQNLGL